LLICLSQLVTDFPEIVELDMNPVVVERGNPFAVDARVKVKSSSEIPGREKGWGPRF